MRYKHLSVGANYERGTDNVPADVIAEARKAKEQAARSQIIADQALQAGVINHDQYAQFLNASATLKNAMIGALIHAMTYRNFRPSATQFDIPTAQQIWPGGREYPGYQQGTADVQMGFELPPLLPQEQALISAFASVMPLTPQDLEERRIRVDQENERKRAEALNEEPNVDYYQ